MKRVLRRVGFFREMGWKEDPSIDDVQWGTRALPEAIEYLTSGQLFIGSPGPARDVYDVNCGFVGSESILTDGVWAWREDTAHYVSEHGLLLPPEFVAHMRAMNFRIPELSIAELRGLSL